MRLSITLVLVVCSAPALAGDVGPRAEVGAAIDFGLSFLVKDALAWDKELGFGPNVRRMLRNGVRPTMVRAGLPLATELYLGMRKRAPKAPDVHVSLQNWARRLTLAVRQHSHEFKLAAKREEEKIVTRQVVQARLAERNRAPGPYHFDIAAESVTLFAAFFQAPSSDEGDELVVVRDAT